MNMNLIEFIYLLKLDSKRAVKKILEEKENKNRVRKVKFEDEEE